MSKLTYNRYVVGERLRLKRTLLGFTKEQIAEKMEHSAKYYADIERGSCGMSIETLMALSKVLDMKLDYIIYGYISESNVESHTDEVRALIELINSADMRTQKNALNLLRLFLTAITTSTLDICE